MKRMRMIGLTAVASFAMSAIAGSAQASTLPAMSFTVNGPSLTVGGAPKSGAVNVTTSETGFKEVSASLFLLKPGVTVAEFESLVASKTVKGDLNRTSKLGSIVFSVEAESGSPTEAQTYLAPGQYIALASSGKGPPKAKTPFTVAASSSPVPMPTPQATVRSIEFGFTGPTTLHVGELVRFENEGFLVHIDVAAQMRNMKEAKQLIKAIRSGNEKAQRKLGIGGTNFAGPLSHEAFQQETITAKPGIYVQGCFVDTQDHRSHTLLGMYRIIKIVK